MSVAVRRCCRRVGWRREEGRGGAEGRRRTSEDSLLLLWSVSARKSSAGYFLADKQKARHFGRWFHLPLHPLLHHLFAPNEHARLSAPTPEGASSLPFPPPQPTRPPAKSTTLPFIQRRRSEAIAPALDDDRDSRSRWICEHLREEHIGVEEGGMRSSSSPAPRASPIGGPRTRCVSQVRRREGVA